MADSPFLEQDPAGLLRSLLATSPSPRFDSRGGAGGVGGGGLGITPFPQGGAFGLLSGLNSIAQGVSNLGDQRQAAIDRSFNQGLKFIAAGKALGMSPEDIMKGYKDTAKIFLDHVDDQTETNKDKNQKRNIIAIDAQQKFQHKEQEQREKRQDKLEALRERKEDAASANQGNPPPKRARIDFKEPKLDNFEQLMERAQSLPADPKDAPAQAGIRGTLEVGPIAQAKQEAALSEIELLQTRNEALTTAIEGQDTRVKNIVLGIEQPFASAKSPQERELALMDTAKAAVISLITNGNLSEETLQQPQVVERITTAVADFARGTDADGNKVTGIDPTVMRNIRPTPTNLWKEVEALIANSRLLDPDNPMDPEDAIKLLQGPGKNLALVNDMLDTLGKISTSKTFANVNISDLFSRRDEVTDSIRELQRQKSTLNFAGLADMTYEQVRTNPATADLGFIRTLARVNVGSGKNTSLPFLQYVNETLTDQIKQRDRLDGVIDKVTAEADAFRGLIGDVRKKFLPGGEVQLSPEDEKRLRDAANSLQ